MITAVDQDKGRPRGIGYTIVSGKSKSAVFGTYPRGAAAGAQARSCGLYRKASETCLHGQSLLGRGQMDTEERNRVKRPWCLGTLGTGMCAIFQDTVLSASGTLSLKCGDPY